MRKFFTISLTVLSLLFAGIVMSGCSDDDNTSGSGTGPDPDPDPAPLAVMKIEVTETGITEIKAKITPDENTVSYTYAISTENNKEAFESGTMEGIVSVANGDEATYTFPQLTPETQYFLFTRGINEDDKAGITVTMATLTLADDTAIITTVEAKGITKTSIKVRVITENTFKLFYAIGLEDDLAAFEDGTLEGLQEETRNVIDIDLTFEELEVNTEYTIFLRGENEDGVKGPVRTEKISTLDRARVTFEPVNINSSIAHVRFVPNDQCKVHVSIIATTANIEKQFGTTPEEIKITLLKRAKDGFMPSFGAGEVYDGTFNVRCDPGTELTYACVGIDEDNISYVDIGTVTTPAFNPSAPTANVIIEMTENTNAKATFKLTMAEGTYLQARGSLPKSMYDMFKADPTYWDTIMQDLLAPHVGGESMTTNKEYIYELNYTKTVVKAGQEVVLFLAAFNENGNQGQSEIIEFIHTRPE